MILNEIVERCDVNRVNYDSEIVEVQRTRASPRQSVNILVSSYLIDKQIVSSANKDGLPLHSTYDQR